MILSPGLLGGNTLALAARGPQCGFPQPGADGVSLQSQLLGQNGRQRTGESLGAQGTAVWSTEWHARKHGKRDEREEPVPMLPSLSECICLHTHEHIQA